MDESSAEPGTRFSLVEDPFVTEERFAPSAASALAITFILGGPLFLVVDELSALLVEPALCLAVGLEIVCSAYLALESLVVGRAVLDAFLGGVAAFSWVLELDAAVGLVIRARKLSLAGLLSRGLVTDKAEVAEALDAADFVPIELVLLREAEVVVGRDDAADVFLSAVECVPEVPGMDCRGL